MTTGERIAKNREALGYSQLDLALKCGWKTKGAVSKIENAGNDVTLKSVEKIAKALNTTVAELMGWIEVKNLKVANVFDQENVKAIDKGMKEAELIKKYQQLPEDKQKLVLAMIDSWLEE